MRRAAAAIPLAIAAAGTVAGGDAGRRLDRAISAPVPLEVQRSPFAVHFLDVGTGDSAIIDIGTQEIIIDGGDSTRVLDDYLRRTKLIDGPIELVVVTHGDSDHWKGLNRVLGFDGRNPDPPQVLELWEPGYDRDCRRLPSFDAFIDQARGGAVETVRRPLEDTHPPAVRSGSLEPIVVPGLPDVRISVLSTASDPPAENGDCAYRINNASIVLSVELFGNRFLFTGDANGKEREQPGDVAPTHIEALLVALSESAPAALAVDVLKVPHHGSETASTQAFIDAVDPDFVVVSASTRHHLPKETVVDRYEDGRRVVLRTDVNRPNDTDHIICFQNDAGALDCNYEAVLNET